MHKVLKPFWLLPVVFCLAALNPSCDCGDGTTQKSKTQKSKTEYFKERQVPTETTHGKIKMETVQERSDGKIQYQTTDGKTWRVEMTKQADGTYRYGTPDEVK